jgi:hypothetical protein
VAFIAWNVSGMIPGCLGFEVTRIYKDKKSEPRVLAAWVPFRGQANPGWRALDTSVWPIQKLSWRDLTLRRKRDSMGVREGDVEVKYQIRPVARFTQGMKPVPVPADAQYQGPPIALGYIDDGKATDWVDVTSTFGSVSVAFTNGILSGQWLRHAMEENGQPMSIDRVKERISDPKDKLRRYLSGDVLDALKGALKVPKTRAALYELADQELVDAIKANKAKLDIILSNSSKPRDGTEWDAGNAAARKDLHKSGVKATDRMFNNNHIGHNKFAVSATANRVLTGSTNWTPTGLCGQSNNAITIDNADVAKAYDDYWQRLAKDTSAFVTPKPLSVGTSNKQGPEIRSTNGAGAACDVKLDKRTRVRVWFSPNTKRTTKGPDLPPDLADVYSKIRKAEKAILFAVFLPSRSGKLSVIEEAIDVGLKDPSVLVYGAISDPTAMPNYVAPPSKTSGEEDDGEPTGTKRAPLPAVFDSGNVHVVRASALHADDLVGQFEAELLKVGNAIIHDKIVVIDPLLPTCTVIVGSHNLGYKASYENDENLLVIEGNTDLAQAYAVHVLDVYDHYRFRAAQEDYKRQGKQQWDGVLDTDDGWLRRYLDDTSASAGSTASLASYFGGK